MSVAAEEAAPPQEALHLRESITLGEGVVQPDGTFIVDVIRPCVGRGRGTHLYEADMLERDAGVFAGWKMYVDHLSDQARRALGGLPRSVRDLAGRLTESWWDPDVPADPERGFGQGAVRARMKPVPYVRELVEADPELVDFSINADATGVRPTMVGGKRAWLVEGIKPKGSVDVVTEGGAGGRVASIIEAHMSLEDQEAALFEDVSDDDLGAYLKEHRPGLLEALGIGEGDDGDGDGKPDGGAGKDGDEVTITPDALREALSTDEGKALVREIVADDDTLRDLVEAQVADERDAIRAEAEASAHRRIEVRDLRDTAHGLIEAAKLPEAFEREAKAKFDLTDEGPTEGLDVLPELDDSGSVVKSAHDVLTEAVNNEITHARDLMASISPTRVRGQGPTTPKDAGEGDGDGSEKPNPHAVTPAVASLLEAAGFNEPDTVYAPSA